MTEVKKDKGSSILLHLIFFLMFVVIAVNACVFAYIRQRDTNLQETLQFATIMAIFPLSWMLYLRGRVKVPLLIFDAIIWVVVGLGAIGLATGVGGGGLSQPVTMGRSMVVASENVTEQTALWVAIIIRMVSTLYFISRSTAAFRLPLMKIMTGWLWASAFVVNLLSLGVAFQTGIGPQSTWRLGERDGGWLQMNHTASYSALLIILSFQITHFPKLVRLGGGILGAYIMLLCQGRMTILALAGGLITLGVVEIYNNRRYLVPVVVSIALTILCLAGPFREPFLQLGPVQKIVIRSERADWTTGRLETNQAAWDVISTAPPWGNGWSSRGSRFENGILSIGVETGIIGMTLNIVLVLLAFRVAWRVFRYSDNEEDRRVAALLFTLLVFMVLRSIGERNHFFQVTQPLPNAVLVLISYSFAVGYLRNSQKVPAAKSPVLSGVPREPSPA